MATKSDSMNVPSKGGRFLETVETIVSCCLSDCCMSPIFSLACRLKSIVGRTFSGLRFVALRFMCFA